MIELIPKTNIKFIAKRYLFFSISGAVLLAGVISLVTKRGPKWGLDFSGGNIIEFKFQKPPTIDEIRKILRDNGITSLEIQSIVGEGIFIIRTRPEAGQNTDMGKKIQTIFEQGFADRSPALLRKEFVGPTVGKHLGEQTLIAFLLTFAGIIVYVAFRFRSPVWGSAGVFALIHDVLATVGIFSLKQVLQLAMGLRIFSLERQAEGPLVHQIKPWLP